MRLRRELSYGASVAPAGGRGGGSRARQFASQRRPGVVFGLDPLAADLVADPLVVDAHRASPRTDDVYDLIDTFEARRLRTFVDANADEAHCCSIESARFADARGRVAKWVRRSLSAAGDVSPPRFQRERGRQPA